MIPSDVAQSSWRLLFPEAANIDRGALVDIVRSHFEAGRYRDAVNHAMLLANADLWDIEPLILIAVCMQKLGEHHAVLAVCREAALIDPYSPLPALLAGESAAFLGEWSAVRSCVDAATFLAGTDPDPQLLERIAALSSCCPEERPESDDERHTVATRLH